MSEYEMMSTYLAIVDVFKKSDLDDGDLFGMLMHMMVTVGIDIELPKPNLLTFVSECYEQVHAEVYCSNCHNEKVACTCLT